MTLELALNVQHEVQARLEEADAEVAGAVDQMDQFETIVVVVVKLMMMIL